MSEQELELPQGWILSSIKTICKNHDHQRIPISIQKRKLIQGKIPYYGASGIIDYVEKPIFSGKYILIGEDGANLLSRSTPIAFIVEGDFWVNNHAHILSTYENIPLEFLFYYIASISLRPWVSGSAQPKLNQKNLNKIPIPLPPLNEQKRIVSKIKELFSKIDSSKQSLEHTKLQLEQYRYSLLKSTFEGKLTEKWRQENKEFGEWIETKLKDITELIGGGTPSRNNPEYFDGNIVWLTPTEIPKNTISVISDSEEKITELGLKKSSAKLIPKGSVILTTRASIGNVAISGDVVTTNQGFTSFKCSEVISNYYLAYWFLSKKNILESKAKGSTFKEISRSRLKEIDIILPPLEEQEQIVSQIKHGFSLIENTSQIVNSTLQQLETMKISILKQAFEGKLIPQDPNDEPASVLLERIQKEKLKIRQ